MTFDHVENEGHVLNIDTYLKNLEHRRARRRADVLEIFLLDKKCTSSATGGILAFVRAWPFLKAKHRKSLKGIISKK